MTQQKTWPKANIRMAHQDTTRKAPDTTQRTFRPIKYVRLSSQIILLLLLNFTVIGSLYISAVLPILRFPKIVGFHGELAEGVPLCTAGSLERTLTAFWPFPIIILVIGILFLVGLLIGRALCGWACPIGLIQDLVMKFLKFLKINVYEPPRKAHEKMRFIKYAILFTVLALSASIGLAILIDASMGEMYRGLCDPMVQASPTCLGCPTPVLRYIIIDVGSNFSPNLDNPSNIFQLSIFLLFIIGIIAIPRFWCRYLCPVGALSSIFNKVSLLHLHKDQSKCTRCNYCAEVCHTRVESIVQESESARISDTSCTYCLECVEVCPEKALSLKFGNITIYSGGKHWWQMGEKTKSGKEK